MSNVNIAHLYREKDSGLWQIQSVDDHLRGVAGLAAKFADKFGLKSFGHVLGSLHDYGKYRKAFQEYIRKASGLDPSVNISGPKEHAATGANIAQSIYPLFSVFLCNCIAGHHRGLYDQSDVSEKISNLDIPKYLKLPKPEFTDVLTNELRSKGKLESRELHFMTRMLFSCLVDADYIDTESFMMPESVDIRGCYDSIPALRNRLDIYMAGLSDKAPETIVNRIRRTVQEICVKRSSETPDYYSLTVPTGGGKTLASMQWALNHAAHNHMERIIVVIPFTTIIQQTGEIFKRIFGQDNVLEHHSMFDFESISDPVQRQKARLATQNWDSPIVITTNVQFFESLYSNRSSKCRKLHNIANSVIIFDEAQSLPLEFMMPIVDSISILKNHFGCSFLFSTASQPWLKGINRGTNPTIKFNGLPYINEIIPDSLHLHDKLRRVSIRTVDNDRTYDGLVKILKGHNRFLCIVNTRRDAKELYDRMGEADNCFHLSRMMCPEHVNKVIEKIRTLLASDSDTPVKVIATQLVEAGVDIDFPVVFRQEAGLDSILQAAGRCNREGKLSDATTYIFSLDGEHPMPKGFMSKANNARKNLGDIDDYFSPEVMKEYFRKLYRQSSTFDKYDIAGLLYNMQPAYETVADRFRLIDDQSVSIIVDYENSADLIEKLKITGPISGLMKRLSMYSVNMRRYDFTKLEKTGIVETSPLGIHFVKGRTYYSEQTGLQIPDLFNEETLII